MPCSPSTIFDPSAQLCVWDASEWRGGARSNRLRLFSGDARPAAAARHDDRRVTADARRPAADAHRLLPAQQRAACNRRRATAARRRRQDVASTDDAAA